MFHKFFAGMDAMLATTSILVSSALMATDICDLLGLR